MGNPISFKEANYTWSCREHDIPRETPVPVHKSNGLISCWRLSLRERLLVLVTGRVWLDVHGTMPPTRVGGVSPFARHR